MSDPLRKAVVFGEAMIELAGIEDDRARLGVAGDTFNTAVYLARLGGDVGYMTALGDCPFSDRIRHACTAEGIGTRQVLTVPGAAPGLYAVSLDDAGERSFTYWRAQSAARRFFETDDWRDAMAAAEEADLFYLSGITLSLFSDDGRAATFETMDRLRSKGRMVAFDPNYRPKGWPSATAARAAIEQAFALSTVTLPTFDDEQALFGDESPERCAARHAALGVEETVVKHGAEGAFLSHDGWVAPERVVRPLDTTGAGDSFNAGYLAARLAGELPRNAAMAGHRLAARVLSTPGAILPREAW